MTHKIHWTSGENGRRGVSAKSFSLEEATRLCAEMNLSHPMITHVVVSADQSISDTFKSKPMATKVFVPVGLQLTDTSPMPFGQYQNQPMGSLPSSYLDFLRSLDWLEAKWPAVAQYIGRNAGDINRDLDRGERE